MEKWTFGSTKVTNIFLIFKGHLCIHRVAWSTFNLIAANEYFYKSLSTFLLIQHKNLNPCFQICSFQIIQIDYLILLDILSI